MACRRCGSARPAGWLGCSIMAGTLGGGAWQNHFVKPPVAAARRIAPMPTSLIASAVFRDIFSTESMRRVFSDGNRVQKYLNFEAALARAQARLGIIPQDAADEIVRHCDVAALDFAKLQAETARVGYPVLPVVEQIVALCRDGLGEWCHWGATTQDVTDTATVLQIREALTLIEAALDRIGARLAELARK